jgi:hypothetical protein
LKGQIVSNKLKELIILRIIISIIIAVFCCSNSHSQIIHKDDLRDFSAVLITTPVNKPSDWPSDQKFEKNKPLESQFHEFFIGKDSRELQNKFPGWNGSSTSTYSIISIPKNQRFNFVLNIPEEKIQLVLFRNNQFEGGTNYLTIWKVKGDSLEFKYLSDQPIYSGNRIKGLRSDYMINGSREIYLVTEMSNGYDFIDGLEFTFYQLPQSYELTEILTEYSRYTLPSINSKDGYYEMFSYDFIPPYYLITHSSKMTGTKVQDEQLGEYFEFKLDSTKSNLLNLRSKAQK